MSKEDHKKEPKKKKSYSMDEFPIQEYRLVPADHVEHVNSEDEIDLIELGKTLWVNRKTIYKFVGAGFILGILVALLSPKEYVSSATLMPEYSTENQGGASSLLKQYGGLLGISGGSYSTNSNAIRVDLYPQIVQSLTFQQKLAEYEFYFPDEDTQATLFEYYINIKSPGFLGYVSEYSIGLPGKIIGAIFSGNEDKVVSSGSFDSEIISLSKEDMKVINNLRSRVSASLDEKSGIISVSAKMSDPKLAADVAKYTIDELTAYLIEYRTEKVLRDLDFIKEQLAKAETRFQEAQITLAEFRDSNQGSLTAKARTEEQRLNSEYDLAFNLYNSFTQQFEEARLKVQEETPVFKILQPVQVPVNDETSGVMVLFVIIGLSGLFGVIYIFVNRIFFSNNPTVSE